MVKVTDIAYGRLKAPDLDRMEEFLLDFGMVRADRTKDKLFMRGTDSEHHLHVTELGDPDFVGIAFHARNEDDLKELSKMDGVSEVEEVDEPGGGKRVRMTDPDGRQIEVIAGMEQLDPLPIPEVLLNTGANKLNRTSLQRIEFAPSHVKRSAHAVVKTPNLPALQEWYHKHLGFALTDSVYIDKEKGEYLAHFNHIDAGEEYVDHHVFLAVQADEAEFNHLSFEVANVDDVLMGHDYLIRKEKYKHAWGIGRHVLGSQIFDYWRDPWGRIHEHWTDSDMINSDHVPSEYAPEEALTNQWGPDFPEEFLDAPSMHAQ
jgi:catechol 2,3-dioxygenase-like lactoylglutathione lyase family enzyme